MKYIPLIFATLAFCFSLYCFLSVTFFKPTVYTITYQGQQIPINDMGARFLIPSGTKEITIIYGDYHTGGSSEEKAE